MKKVIVFFFPLLVTQLVMSQVFTEQTGFSLTDVYQSSVDWGDYDSDGDLDILMNGYTGSSYITRIYRNDDSVFIDINAGLTGTAQGSVDWGDYDNDGDLDILLTGHYYIHTTHYIITRVYRNNDGVFSNIHPSIPVFTGVYNGVAKWGDYDNDGDLDILLAGSTSSGRLIRIYRNDNNGSFTAIDPGLPTASEMCADWGDFDNDGDIDIVLTGYTFKVGSFTSIYRNDSGFFTDIGAGLSGVSEKGTVTWGDYDNDGDLDLLMTGYSNGYIAKIYENNEGVFMDKGALGLTGVGQNSVSWGDYDNDGDPDILLTGTSATGNISEVFRNDGGIFTGINAGLTGTTSSSVAWGDYDNDGDLDILLTGNTGSGYVSKIFRNDVDSANTKPSSPGNLQVEIDQNTVKFKWDKASDVETPQDGLTYNMYVYESGLSQYGRSPHSLPYNNELNGRRLIAEKGDIQWSTNGYNIKNLTYEVTYNWSVQSIDAGLTGGEFSPEGSFIIPIYTPELQSRSINISGIQATQVTAVWTIGNGSSRTVFIREGITGTADPVDNISYDVDDLTPGGWKCIYNGTANTCIITGLTPGVYYSVHICEYNGPEGYEKYLTETSTGNPTIINTMFSESGVSVDFVYNSSFAWGDYDNDGDLDILLTGDFYDGENYFPVSRIYHNEAGVFTDISAGLIGVYEGSVAWGDYDNDGDLDILLTGLNYTNDNYTEISRIYQNDAGVFTDIEAGLQGVRRSSVTWGDYDNDGDLDILLTGLYYNGFQQLPVTKIYENDSGKFIDIDAGLTNVSSGDVAWGDYDNDGDLDILLTGQKNYPDKNVSIIYRNDKGTFTSINSELPGISKGKVDWGDYDGDGDLDIILTGSVSDNLYITRVYRNDAGQFIDVEADLPVLSNGTVAWGDCDNDGDLDILFTGKSDLVKISRIFINDAGTFRDLNIILNGTDEASVAWGDYDNDNDLDIFLLPDILKNNNLIINNPPEAPQNLDYKIVNQDVLLSWDKVETDETGANSMSYNIRIGNESGSSSLVPSHSATGGYRRIVEPGNAQLDTSYVIKKLRWDTIYYGSVQAVDNSYIGGAFSNEVSFSISPKQASNLSASHISASSLMLRWTRGDGDKCIVFAREGSSDVASPVNFTTYYYNPVFGEGSPVGTSGWYCIYKGEADSVLLSGLKTRANYVIHVIEFQGKDGSEVYSTNNDTGNIGVFSAALFSEQTEIVLTGVKEGSVAWGDYDNDGDLDIVLTGDSVGTGNAITYIYNNDSGTFTDIKAGLQGVYFCNSANWGDYDNDGDLDLLTGNIINVNNNNVFTNINAAINPGFSIWGDYDNDNDLDILNSGLQNLLIYKNDSGVFTEIDTGLPGISTGSITWVDFDNDGDLDIIVCGIGLYGLVFNIYRNENSSYYLDTSLPVTPYYQSLDCGDYDNDGDLDLLSGNIIYRNDGGVFTAIDCGLDEGFTYWGDYNNDGLPDILLLGYNGSKIYFNNGNSEFNKDQDNLFPGIIFNSMASGDYDNDGDLDILITGQTDEATIISRIFRNNLIMKSGEINLNTQPAAPVGLITNSKPEGIELSWSPVEGDETPSAAMSYNVRVISVSEGVDVTPVHSDTNTGYRRIVSPGNAQLDTTHLLRNLPVGTYYWQVQAIDQGYLGGTWSVLDSFVVKNIQPFFHADTICQGLATHFTDQSVAADGITFWHWDFSDGSSSDIQNPEYTFADAGTYHVKLVITSTEGDKDSLIQEVIVKPKPLVDFIASLACQGSETTLTNLTDAQGLTITSWSWDYGDGKGSILQNPGSHGYLTAGDYQLTLYAIANNGCEGLAQQTVTVGSYPVAVITAGSPLSFCAGDSVVLSVGNNPDYTYRWLSGGVGITAADKKDHTAKISGSYSVEVVNTRGNCLTTASPVTVTRLDMPPAPVIVTADYTAGQCMSDNPVTLSVDQAVSEYNYQWKRNGVIISDAVQSSLTGYLPAGDYSVVAGLSTCRTESAVKTISYDEAPAKPLIHAEGPVVWFLACSNDSAAQYRWYYEGVQIPGANKYIYVANQDLGEYYVSIANIRGCFTASDVMKIPPDAIGIDEADIFSTLKIFPNPTTGLFNIVMNNQVHGDLIISVYTEEGRKVWNSRYDKITEYFSCEVDMSGNGSGVYFVNLKAGNKEVNRKLIVQ